MVWVDEAHLMLLCKRQAGGLNYAGERQSKFYKRVNEYICGSARKLWVVYVQN